MSYAPIKTLVTDKGSIYIGWGQADYTPNGSIRLVGQFHERVSQYVHTPISATALVIETRDSQGASLEQIIFCGCDVGEIYDEVTHQVRAQIQQRNPEIPVHKICLNATHIHTGPVLAMDEGNRLTATMDRFLPEEMRNQDASEARARADINEKDYWPIMIGAISDAILTAWENRQQGGLSWQLGHAAVGFNRRVSYQDGTSQMYGATNTPNYLEPEGPEDHGVELLYTWDSQGELTGALVNVPCPAQVLELKEYVAADYWGELRLMLPERLGKSIHIMPMCGIAGDISPRDMVRCRKGVGPNMYEVDGAKEAARRILNTLIDRLEPASKTIQNHLQLTHINRMIPLPLRTVTRQEYEQAKKEFQAVVDAKTPGERMTVSDMYSLFGPGGIMERYEMQQTTGFYNAEIHVARIGDIAYACNPFELFTWYGMQIRARSRAPQTFLGQLSIQNGVYLPTEKAVKGGHYSAIVSSGICGPQGGKVLVENTVEMINSLWPETAQ